MSRLPRTTCPICGRDVALRRGGQLREHRRQEGTHNPVCSASGHTPAGAVGAAASRAREIAEQARRVCSMSGSEIYDAALLVDVARRGPIRWTVIVRCNMVPVGWCGHAHRNEERARACAGRTIRRHQEVVNHVA